MFLKKLGVCDETKMGAFLALAHPQLCVIHYADLLISNNREQKTLVTLFFLE